MLEQPVQDLVAWKNQMKIYQKQKRTKKPFGKDAPYTHHVTHKQVKQKQLIFNPVLQTFNDPFSQIKKNQKDQFIRAKSLMNHARQNKKYERNYDIVNLHSSQEQKPAQIQSNGKKLGPLRNAYNVINNTKLPDYYFQNRQMKLPVQRQKNLIQNNAKQFNIVTGVYYIDHEQRIKQQQQVQKQKTINKFQKAHVYDPVFGKFYSEQKQKNYQEQLMKLQKQHGKDYQSKFPPSYRLPQSLQTIDEKRMNQRKRYQLKYVVEDQYNQRNIQEDQKHQKIVKNKVHDGRIQENKLKQFDIITMKHYDINRAEQLFNRKIGQTTWERFKAQPAKIKTGGFN